MVQVTQGCVARVTVINKPLLQGSSLYMLNQVPVKLQPEVHE